MAFDLLLDLGLIVLMGTLFAYLARLLRQPLFVGYVAAGLVMGPFLLNVIQDPAGVAVLSELGVAFLLFAVGMEVDISRLLEFKKILVLGGIAQIAVTVLGVQLIFGAMGLPFVTTLYLGFMLAFSSTAVVVKLLSAMGRMNDLDGRLIIGYLLVQDVVAILVLPALANIETIYSAGSLLTLIAPGLLLVALGFALSLWVFPRLFKYAAHSNELFYLTTLSSCFIFIFLSAVLDFSIAVGAFIGGIAISRIDFSVQAESVIRSLSELFATVFFVSLGLQLTGLPSDWGFFAMILLVLVLLNSAAFFLINLVGGFGFKSALFIGLVLAGASEFSFILAFQGIRLKQISAAFFNDLIWVLLVSIVLTPVLISLWSSRSDRLLRTYRRLAPKAWRDYFSRRLRLLERLPDGPVLHGHVVLAGGGMFGEQLADALSGRVPVVLVDPDPVRISRLIRKNYFALYASRENHHVFERVRLSEARALVCSIPRIEDNVSMVQRARGQSDSLLIVARAHSFADALDLYTAGADWVVLPQVLAGNAAVSALSEFLQTGKLSHGLGLRDEYLNWLREKVGEEARLNEDRPSF